MADSFVGMSQTEATLPPSYNYYEDVKISKVVNGFIVAVGCKTFVSTSWKEVYTKLGEYWDDPAAAEKKYVLNNKKRGKK